ncbi:MAG: hypothetical protein IJ719_04125 [Clostridia bacterium]|nr:hypothetical protein [Clostridia bacterium]
MSVRLDEIERFLLANLGRAFLVVNPDMPYAVSRILLGSPGESSMAIIWERLDSYLFNIIYTTTSRTMLLIMDDQTQVRVTQASITEMADQLVSFMYRNATPNRMLEEQLYDLSRAGSFCAMQELLSKYQPPQEEREMIERILRENGRM